MTWYSWHTDAVYKELNTYGSVIMLCVIGYEITVKKNCAPCRGKIQTQMQGQQKPVVLLNITRLTHTGNTVNKLGR